MKLFTRIFLLWTAVVVPLSAALATTFTVQVGDNFYRTNGSNLLTIVAGDQVTWTNVGNRSHPTASDNGAWATFPMGPGVPDRTITFNTPGLFPYHCTAHGSPGSGQFGIITVQARPSATEEARSAGLALQLFPNPSRGLVTVQLGAPKAGSDYKLRFANVIGQEVRTVALKPELSASGLALDLRDMPPGLYFYTLLVDGKAVASKRLTLQN